MHISLRLLALVSLGPVEPLLPPLPLSTNKALSLSSPKDVDGSPETRIPSKAPSHSTPFLLTAAVVVFWGEIIFSAHLHSPHCF